MKKIIINLFLIFTSLLLHANPVVYNITEAQVTASIDRQRLFASMQGIGARQGKWIFLGNTDGDFWANQLKNEGVQYTYFSNWSTLLSSCSELLQRYVLYDPAIVDGIPRNAEIAFTMAGLSNAVIVTPALESQIQSYGGQKILDVRSWSWANVPTAATDSNWFGNVQTDRTDRISYLADFCVANTSMWRFVPPEGPAGEPNFFDHFSVGSTFLGWFFGAEGDAVSEYSGRGMYAVPADWTANLAPLSRSASAVSGDIRQPIRKPERIEGTNIHLVALIISDGDNFNLWNGMYRNNSYWNNGYRGNFAVNWTYPPRNHSLARIAHKYYFSNATANDYFISGPSGAGYYYPDRIPNSASRETFAATDNNSMNNANIGVWCPMFKDSDFTSAKNILEEMLGEMPAVKAVFPWTYNNAYKDFNGEKTMISGIPVLSIDYSIWNGFDTPESAAADINSKSTDLNNADAYSIVIVHMWSYNLNDIAEKFVANLDSNVKIVDAWTLADTFARKVGNFGMVKNGTVENGTSWPEDWFHSFAQTQWSEEKSVSPTHSLKISDTSTAENADWRSVLFSLPAFSSPPRAMEFSWHWSYSGIQGTWQAGIRWYTNDSTASFIGEELFSPPNAEQSDFVREVHTVIPPSEAKYADITFRSWGDASLGTMWMDNIAVRVVDSYINVNTNKLIFSTDIYVENVKTVIVENLGEGILIGNVSNVFQPFSVENDQSYTLTNITDTSIIIKFLSNESGSFTNEVVFTGGGGTSLELIGEVIPEPYLFLIYYLLTGKIFFVCICKNKKI